MIATSMAKALQIHTIINIKTYYYEDNRKNACRCNLKEYRQQ